ncbi:cyclic nucleotide-binding domain-containing protein [Kordiimonas marina]|uniref:cyclic nucleotide-binding domain-containing protein n=1 Tax=Kordiimonas marina TaxID=2872312 RepID=UPI001FF1559A|nr:cyclic nucleotide-binding domain-containing protein [Kordiimonas marina]MCJ9429193.1 cyclic nucleotide-binding domain-containing protein [Kordiimonas marina]
MTETEHTTGREIIYELGDTVYEQGSPSDGIYMILDGRIDIWHENEDDAHHIASLGSGELLGEVSVIERANHSVSARASCRTKVLFIDAEAFRRSFSDPLVRHVVHTLAARLRSSYSAKQTSDRTDGKIPHFKSDKPTIEGSSRLVADRLLTFVELKEYPFTVGNIHNTEKHAVISATGLKIPLPSAPELADNHFEIIKREGELWVRDLGSQHGTMVNGEKLSKYTMKATSKLKPGQNVTIAGSAESPVRFIITVPFE